MKRSAGIAIIWNKKILLAHPTGHSWDSSFTIPKGTIEDDESKKEAAIRETFEEVGLVIFKDKLINEKIIIDYLDKKGNVYKQVYCYPLYINELYEIGLDSLIIPREQLQLKEIDFARFVGIDEFDLLAFHRFNPLKKLLEL